MFEHVRATTGALARIQRVLDATLWPRLAGGCHLHRDPVDTLTLAGFDIQTISHFRFPDSRVTLPSAPHVLAVATTPTAVDHDPE